MKKSISILGCFILVVVLAVTVLAADLNMTLAADKTIVKAGDVVTFAISAPEIAGCTAGGFSLDGCYDTEVFEFVGGECPLDGTMLENVGYIGGKLSGSFMYSTATDVSGTLFTIQLKVKNTAPLGKTVVAPTVSIRNSDGAVTAGINAVELEVVAVAMTLTADKTTAVRGDVVTFAISVPDLADCKSGGFSLDGCYDTEVFEFVGGECPLDGTMLENVGYIGGKLSGSFMYTAATDVSGTLFTIQMKVKDSAAFGKTTVTPTVSVRNSDGALVAAVNALELTVVCDHNWGEGVVTTPATCTIDGLRTYTCSICGEVKTEAVAMLGHKMDAGVVTTAPTCTDDGVRTYTCENGCGLTTVEAVAKLPHVVRSEVTKEPTCTEEGEKTAICTVCKQVLYIEVVAKLGHSPETTVTKEPTYTEDGEQVTTCTTCGEVLAVEKLDRLPGNLDGNETLDEDDVIYLLQHVLMPEDFTVTEQVNYDDNNDVVDEDDVIYLLQHLLMPDDFPLR